MTFFFQYCNSDSYETVNSSVMKMIYDSVKNAQSRPVATYRPPYDEYDDNDLYAYDDDYSEEEGTSAPVKSIPFDSFIAEPEVNSNPHSQLLTGFTKENWEINVNILTTDNQRQNCYKFFNV